MVDFMLYNNEEIISTELPSRSAVAFTVVTYDPNIDRVRYDDSNLDNVGEFIASKYAIPESKKVLRLVAMYNDCVTILKLNKTSNGWVVSNTDEDYHDRIVGIAAVLIKDPAFAECIETYTRLKSVRSKKAMMHGIIKLVEMAHDTYCENEVLERQVL